MPWPREIEACYYRPELRRLINLSNEELRAIYDIRAAKVHYHLKPEGFWDNNQIIYWNSMMPAMTDLYEVLMEIQARYPISEVGKHGFDDRLLPVMEKHWVMAYLSRYPLNANNMPKT